MEKLKIRCSALGKIMHFDNATQITDKQLVTLNGLLAKSELTEPQKKEMNRLIKKRDAKPQLSAGAKTYIRDVFYGHKFNYQKRFISKQTHKGNKMEDPAISQIVKMLGLPMVFKNEKRYENDYINGTPDVPLVPLNFQFDVKNVYYPNGLDLTQKLDHDYEWQGHGYDSLLGVDFGMVIKILMNPPDDILQKEARTLWVEAGNEWGAPISEPFMAEVRDYLDFEGKQPIEDRVKIFSFKTEEKQKQEIRDAVKLAREYYQQLENDWKVKNRDEIAFIKLINSKKSA